MEEGGSAFKIVIGTPTGKRPVERSRRRWAGYAARWKEDKSTFKILTSKSIGKRPLGRPRSRWEDNIRMYLKGIGVNTRNRENWRALVNAALNLRVS